SREPAVEYVHTQLGYNYRLSNVLAGIGRGQLRVLAERVAQRRAVFARYAEALADLDGVRFQPEAPWGTHTRWLTVMHLDPAAASPAPRRARRGDASVAAELRHRRVVRRRDPLAADDRAHGAPEDPQVERERGALHVLDVELELLRPSDRVAPADLREPGDAR